MTLKGLSVWFAALLALSLYSRWEVMESRRERCSLDGNRIVPAYQVDLLLDGAPLGSFCCVRCARDWPDAPRGASWRVRDELSGRPIDARKACFVESGVVTQSARRDHTHSFERWDDAQEHLAEFGGERIPNPFDTANPHAGNEHDETNPSADD